MPNFIVPLWSSTANAEIKKVHCIYILLQERRMEIPKFSINKMKVLKLNWNFHGGEGWGGVKGEQVKLKTIQWEGHGFFSQTMQSKCLTVYP